MCLIHIATAPVWSTHPATWAIQLPSSSTYSAIQTIAALSWLSLQTNFTKLLPSMTLRQSTLYSVMALLRAMLQFLLDETTKEWPIVFQLALNQKSA